MNTYLDRIMTAKAAEVAELEQNFREIDFTRGRLFNRTCISLKEKLSHPESSGIIAEFKRKSPTKGVIHATAKVAEVTRGYAEAGAAGLSVLTDTLFFGGTLCDLETARLANPETPILRKDFVMAPLQVAQAKAFGADVVLLIAACLTPEQIHDLAQYARSLGMETLLELHDASELDKISPLVDLVGVNNRNLKSFTVDLDASIHLASLIPGEWVKISESGLSSPETILMLHKAGFRGFLMGEHFMKKEDPAEECRQFIDQLRNTELIINQKCDLGEQINGEHQ